MPVRLTHPKERMSVVMSKTLPDFVVEGAITVTTADAFNSILRLFPDCPELLRMQGDLLAGQGHRAAAACQYDQAAQFFLRTGKLIQAVVCKSLEWRLARPSRKSVLKFHLATEVAPHDERPVNRFVQRLTPQERMAVFARFERFQVPAGRPVRKCGETEDGLFFVVSGRLREFNYQAIDRKTRIHRESLRTLEEGDFYGDVFPLHETAACRSWIEASTAAELVFIPKRRLIQLCWKYPNVEQGVIRLSALRAKLKSETLSDMARRGERYKVPVRITVELLAARNGAGTLILNGTSTDLSVSGLSFTAEIDGMEDSRDLYALVQKADTQRVRVILPSRDLSVAIAGKIIRSRRVIVDGSKTLALGIQFAEIPPLLRGAFFSIAGYGDRLLQKVSA